jgi:ATP-dependent Clp protease protease subunit
MNLKYCKNIAENEYELILQGEVGVDIRGRDVAAEILYLDSIGAEVIKERINTIGGTVIDAFSIVSANISCKCEIHTVNEGVADSSGSFILASGNKRSAFDFATMLVHNVSYDGVMLEDMEDSKLKNELMVMRDSIVTILSNNSNQTPEEVKEMMNESKRMTAKEAKKFGFIDEIIKSDNTPKIVENMSMAELMNVCKIEETLKIDNTMDIKELENKVENLNGQITAKDDTISSLENKVTEKDAKIEEVENKLTAKNDEITDLQNKVKAFELKEVENAVKAAIDSGKFGKDAEEKLTSQCETMGVENFNEMVGMVVMPKADAAGLINNKDDGAKKTSKNEKLAEEFENLSKEDPKELKRIMNVEPERFKLMETAYNES